MRPCYPGRVRRMPGMRPGSFVGWMTSSSGCSCMKVTLRIPLSDEVRRYIGAQFSPEHRTNKTGMAYRKACRTWLETKIIDQLPELAKLAPPPEPPALTDDEKKA